MVDFVHLSEKLGCNIDETMIHLEDFVHEMQVHLANLEDAIPVPHYNKMIKACHNISQNASALHLDTIALNAEHIELLAMFTRRIDYTLLFTELHQSIKEVHNTLEIRSHIISN